MKNIPILGKIFAVLGLFGLFIIAVAIYAAHQMNSINHDYSQLSVHQTKAAISVARASRSFQTARVSIAELMLSTTSDEAKQAMKNFEPAHGPFESFMDKAITVAPEQDKPAVRDLKAASLQIIDQDCLASIKAGLAATGPQSQTTITQYKQECAPRFPEMTKKITAMAGHFEKSQEDLQRAISDSTSTSVLVTLGGILVGLLLVFAGAFSGVRLWIVNPLNTLQSVMARLAAGDFDTVIHGAGRKDELGGMARAVQVFKDNGLERIRLEREAEMSRKDVEAERQRSMLQSKDAAERQTAVVNALAGGLDHLSNGDLTYRLNDVFPAEYEKLRTDFNSAIQKLDGTMNVIGSNAGGIRSGADQISQAADDLSKRTEQQAANLEETAAALDEITATVKKTADGAKSANSAVATTKSDAERSGEIVRQAVTAMSAIEASSNQVSQIIGVIDEIAFQTNLLALNAGVEAARAGDAGRGFAVVAQEVRALAQRSADAAKEIKGLISESTQQVTAGVDLVGKTGLALEKIVGQVNEISLVVTEIASSAQEQSTGLHQVNTAVNQMDQMTQQNAAMVEESTAASHALLGESNELARLIGQFRTSSTFAASRDQTASAGSAARASGGRSAVRSAGRGGAAIKEPDASWEEF